MYDLLLLNIVRDNSLNPAFMECLGQHSIASYIGKYGFGARVYSGGTDNAERVIKSELKKNGPHFVGLYASADNLNIVKNITSWLKSVTDMIVFVGGPEAVSCNEEFLKQTGCDVVIESEGEEAICRLLDYYINNNGKLEDIPNIKYYNNENVFVRNPVTSYIDDLDSVPFPKYENSLNKRFRKGSMVGLITGRGCPFGCSFCYEGANAKNVRFRSIDNVMEEIDYILAHNPNVETFNIYDDTFTLRKERVYQFCDEMKKRNLQWVCEGHISNLVKYPEMVKYMVRSGLVGLQIGIESGSDKVLKAYNKQTTANDILETVKICKEAGLPSLTGNFIIGGAHENIETFNDSLTLAKRMIEAGRGMFECRSVFMAPYPNTKISNNPELFGLHIDENLLNQSIYTMHNPVMSTDELSIDDITRLRDEFNKEIEKTYEDQVLKCNKYEIMNGLVHNGKMVNRVFTWYEFYEKTEHLNCFIKNAMGNHCSYDERYFPIRTFCDPNYVDNLKVSKLEKQFLEMANGKNSILQISEKLYLSPIQARNIYEKMNYKCLVYMSRF